MADASEGLRRVKSYHERTKHRPGRYAASLGYLDWSNQPDRFRTFEGAEQIALPQPSLRDKPTYDELFTAPPSTMALDAELVGRLFYHSLALSAWQSLYHFTVGGHVVDPRLRTIPAYAHSEPERSS